VVFLRPWNVLPEKNPVPDGDILVWFKPLGYIYGLLRRPTSLSFAHPQKLLARLDLERRSRTFWELGAAFEQWRVAGVLFVFCLLVVLASVGSGR
jgi:hypothetical protein